MSDLENLVRGWTSSGRQLIMNPGYYVGRPPTTSDIDTRTLEGIYQGIKATKGDAAAKKFVRFVNKLDDLSATNFVLTFQKFWEGGCKEIDIELSKATRSDVVSSREQSFAQLATALAGRKKAIGDLKREHVAIKKDFIAQRVNEIPLHERRTAFN